MATDIGISLGRIAKGKSDEWWKIQMQAPLLIAFFSGGLCGTWAHRDLGKKTMFIPVFMFGSIGLLYVWVVAHARGESLYAALCTGEDNPFAQHFWNWWSTKMDVNTNHQQGDQSSVRGDE